MSDLLYLDLPEFFVPNLMFAKQPKASSKEQPSRNGSQRPATMSIANVRKAVSYAPVAAEDELDSFGFIGP